MTCCLHATQQVISFQWKRFNCSRWVFCTMFQSSLVSQDWHKFQNLATSKHSLSRSSEIRRRKHWNHRACFCFWKLVIPPIHQLFYYLDLTLHGNIVSDWLKEKSNRMTMCAVSGGAFSTLLAMIRCTLIRTLS